jgi:hypothetical protein
VGVDRTVCTRPAGEIADTSVEEATTACPASRAAMTSAAGRGAAARVQVASGRPTEE